MLNKRRTRDEHNPSKINNICVYSIWFETNRYLPYVIRVVSCQLNAGWGQAFNVALQLRLNSHSSRVLQNCVRSSVRLFASSLLLRFHLLAVFQHCAPCIPFRNRNGSNRIHLECFVVFAVTESQIVSNGGRDELNWSQLFRRFSSVLHVKKSNNNKTNISNEFLVGSFV